MDEYNNNMQEHQRVQLDKNAAQQNQNDSQQGYDYSNYGQPNQYQQNFGQSDQYQQNFYSQPYPNGQYPGQQPPKSRIAAGLLGIFLGGWGIHRFYLGYTKMGIIQIIVSLVTCGFGSLWGFVEGILILCGSQITTDANGNPLGD